MCHSRNFIIIIILCFLKLDKQFFWWIERSKDQHLFEIEIFCNIINVLTVKFDQFNASLLNKYSFLEKHLNDPKLLNGSVGWLCLNRLFMKIRQRVTFQLQVHLNLCAKHCLWLQLQSFSFIGLWYWLWVGELCILWSLSLISIALSSFSETGSYHLMFVAEMRLFLLEQQIGAFGKRWIAEVTGISEMLWGLGGLRRGVVCEDLVCVCVQRGDEGAWVGQTF